MNKASLLLSLLLVACSAAEDGSTKASTNPSTTRSAACKEMQDALCDRLADRCSQLQRVECDDQFQSLFCKSDESAKNCTAAVKDATCDGTPAACQAIADVAPAITLCNQFSEQYCVAAAACGGIDRGTCLQELGSALPCTKAVGISAGYDACKTDVDKASCNEQKLIDLPASCKGVVKLLSTIDPSPTSEWQSVARDVPEDFLAR